VLISICASLSSALEEKQGWAAASPTAFCERRAHDHAGCASALGEREGEERGQA